MIKLKVKKNDEVIVISGKDKGKKGRILQVNPKERKVLVSGVNIVKKHLKPSKNSPGGIIAAESFIDVSNIAFFDNELGQATKLGYKFLPDGKKVRVIKKSGRIIDNKGK